MILPVFVYGTLRPGETAFDELGLADRVDIIGPATVGGHLYDLGDYPAALLEGGGIIHGELLLPRDEAVLAMLDEYELYDPAKPAESEYLRVQAMTQDSDLSIWIYVYNSSLNCARLIPCGDWRGRARP